MTGESTISIRRPILVVGMFRSGTSLTANLVHEWGAFGGDPRRLADGDERNPRGYWQHPRLGSFVSQMMRDIGINFWHPSFPAAVRSLADVPRYRETAFSLAAEMASSGRAWFWKEPKLSVLLPFWKEICPDAIYVMTVRSPYDCALSWQKYALPETVHGKVHLVGAALLWWQATMMDVVESTESCRSKYFIPYEHLIARPEEECRKLGRFLCGECGIESKEHSYLSGMINTVDPQLRRMRAGKSLDEVDVATDAQRSLYQFLLMKVANPALPFNRASYPFHPGWKECLDNTKLLCELYEELEQYKAGNALVCGL